MVFALHPVEEKQVVRNFTTTPASIGRLAPDYLIRTNESWNYALDLKTEPTFESHPSPGWSLE